MKLQILKGSTDVSIDLFIQSTAVSTGAGLTGLAYNSSGLTCYYHRPGSTAAALTLATQTVTGAHSDGGFVEIDATNMPGFYRLDLSDAIVASGVNSVSMTLKGATNMAQVTLEIALVAYNPQDSVRLGLTALPNAAADAAGGLPISDAGGLDLDARLDVAVSSRLASAGYTAPLDAAGTRSAIGLAAADLDTQLAAIGAPVTAYLDATISSRFAAASAPANFSALGITVGGNLSVVDLVNTLTTYTGNTPQTGDFFAAFAEVSAVPAAGASLASKLGFLAAMALNKLTQTATTMTLRNNADGADIGTAPTSDDGTTATRGKFS